MKHIMTLLLFAAPFAIKAQEQPTTNKKTAPPTTEKSISEKGVSSTKGRGLNATTTSSTTTNQNGTPAAPAAQTKTATAADKPKD